jgi:predicted aspartyl protease
MNIVISLHKSDGQKVETKALIDSGAAGLFIDRDYAKRIGLRFERLPRPIPVFNVDGTRNSGGDITEKVTLQVEIAR